jgi:hypothetical protein
VTVATKRGQFTKQAFEALGARQVPFDDRLLGEKFHDVVDPIFGRERADRLLEMLWALDDLHNIKQLLDAQCALITAGENGENSATASPGRR